MKLKAYETCILADDPWDKIIPYLVQNIENGEYTLSPSNEYYGKGQLRKISSKDNHTLLIYPFSFYMRDSHEELCLEMHRVGDLVYAILSKHGILTLDKLSSLILEHQTKYGFSKNSDVTWILRCLTAAKKIIATCKKNVVSFTLSPALRERENQRKFSATIASELAALSERVRYIISHGPTVGTYRENLLQNTLKKHLPERYHVATGFIFGLSRQIDILIYDRVDYAPVFREGELVIVPPESVRAVIEVKTNLTALNLESALELLNLTSYLDDNTPPFFKGVFAFESDLKNDTIYQKIADFYTDLNLMSQGGPGALITRPFQHLTCACVNNKAFAYTKYGYSEDKRLKPILYSKNSATELESQSSFFMQSLLSHLKFGGMKPLKIDYMGRMLGEDTFTNKIKDLTDDFESWGDYARFDEGEVEEDAVKDMEKLILTAQRWHQGEENF